jgi:molybdopterin-guanine dinucleotide biosynthesis protein A
LTAPNERDRTISAFILAGGASSRMGSDKALLDFRGEPLIAHTARLLARFAKDIVVIGAPKQYSHLGLHVIADAIVRASEDGEPLRTPLVGIATALSVSSSPWNLILACDLPYLTSRWLAWFLARARRSTALVVMPRTASGLEPLAAIYHRDCLASILDALKQGVRKVTDATSGLRAEIVQEKDWSELDPEGCVLTNMNSPADYQCAKAWWENENSRA